MLDDINKISFQYLLVSYLYNFILSSQTQYSKIRGICHLPENYINQDLLFKSKQASYNHREKLEFYKIRTIHKWIDIDRFNIRLRLG
ncbi:hypothetical protein DERF_008912 [Dermatophagoides farinae]|uniref:Uncharacterized protein n=1 Tax=Dermatophagoides farinae TaxID=6954 RepID=A0A922L5X8_DERFA|nr:hypothetical protein DERF_008912 [Dermatophagoides farinae]